jgi:hypothetical protein
VKNVKSINYSSDLPFIRTFTNLDFRLCDATHKQACHESKCNSPLKLNALIFPQPIHKNVIQITRIVMRLKHVNVYNNVAHADKHGLHIKR